MIKGTWKRISRHLPDSLWGDSIKDATDKKLLDIEDVYYASDRKQTIDSKELFVQNRQEHGRLEWGWRLDYLHQKKKYDVDVYKRQIQLFIAHQANNRIIQSLAKKMGLPEEKVYVNVNRYGNTSAASVGIALDEAVRSGRVKHGDIVVPVSYTHLVTAGFFNVPLK